MPTIDYVAPIPEKPHVLHVGLRDLNADGKPYIREVPVRKAHYESLTPARQVAYVQECAEFHHPGGPDGAAKRKARRAAWDAADKAAEEAKFVMTPQGFVKDAQGVITGVRVSVTHQGHSCTCVIPPDPAAAKTNALAEWTKSKSAADGEKAALAAFAVSV